MLLEIISGRRNGVIAALLRLVMWALTPVYRLATALRNRRFDNDVDSVTRMGVPVISIGNLTTGGTGKTPLVIWICRQIRNLDYRVAIVSRGYGAAVNDDLTAQPNDEALELGQRLPDVPHLQNPDRVVSAKIAIEELETQCIVMDDGFQHRRLGRDLDIVVVDATVPFGYGYVLPRGLLREPLKNIARADFVVISRCDQVSDRQLGQIEATIKRHRPDMPIAKTKVQPASWMQFDGRQKRLAELKTSMPGQPNPKTPVRVFVCCAIGNPESFVNTVTSTGVNIVGQKFFSDHHLYDRQDIASVVELAIAENAEAIVCTHKDLVKIGVNRFKGLPIYALVAEIVFLDGEPSLGAAVGSALREIVSPPS